MKKILLITFLLFTLINCNTQNKDIEVKLKNKNSITGFFEAGDEMEYKDILDTSIVHLMSNRPFISEKEISKISIISDELDELNNDETLIRIELNKKGSKILNKWTKYNLNQEMFVMLDNQLITSPRVVGVLEGSQISTVIKKELFKKIFVTK